MKLNCGLEPWKQRELDRKERLRQAQQDEKTWFKHFCLWPVRLGDNDCRWLEVVEKQPVYKYDWNYTKRWDVKGIANWKYRAIE